MSSKIRVTSFSVDSAISFDVPEGIIHKSSLAAMIAITCGAVDQILFAEGDELSCSLEVLSFQ